MNIERSVRNHFGEWGVIERFRVIPRCIRVEWQWCAILSHVRRSKAIAFITYTLRCAAEFAKEAMHGQTLGLYLIVQA